MAVEPNMESNALQFMSNREPSHSRKSPTSISIESRPNNKQSDESV